MSHFLGIQAWQMRQLTPREHDAAVAQTNLELEAIRKAAG